MKKIILFLMFVSISSDFLPSSNNQAGSKKLEELRCFAATVISCLILGSCLTPQNNYKQKPCGK